MTRPAAFLALLLTGIVALSTAAQAEPEATARYGAADAGRRLLVRGTTDIELFERLLRDFVATSPAFRIDYEQWGSNDLFARALADCAHGGPGADMIISSAVDLQVKLVNDGCAQAYRSELTQSLPAHAKWRDELFGITREPAVMIYNRDLVPESEAPRSRFDLLDLLRPEDSRYAGRVATYDIEASGLGYLFAFLDSQQATTFGSLIEAFARSRAVATCCSAEIIDGVISGRYLIAYNVLGSYALARASETPSLVVVAPQDYTLVLARAAMIPRNAAEPDGAGRLLDFLFSPAGHQALVAEHLIVDLADPDASVLRTPADARSAQRQIPLSPVLLVGLDQQRRAQFLALWRNTFLER